MNNSKILFHNVKLVTEAHSTDILPKSMQSSATGLQIILVRGGNSEKTVLCLTWSTEKGLTREDG